MSQYQIVHGRCEDAMPKIESKSIDLILCDLPYGQTRHAWDCKIPLGFLHVEYDRILKDRGVMILHAMQPFTTDLINEFRPWFRQELIWDKVCTTGYLDAGRRPLRRHESILVFAKIGTIKYNPMKTEPLHAPFLRRRIKNTGCYGSHAPLGSMDDGSRYPTTIMRYSNSDRKKMNHPTAKPIPLLEQLIKMYSNEGDLVLDNAMGSGSTGVAAVNLGRRFIGIEKDEAFFKIAEQRIEAARALRESA